MVQTDALRAALSFSLILGKIWTPKDSVGGALATCKELIAAWNPLADAASTDTQIDPSF